MSPNAIDCYNLTSWTNCNCKPTNPLKSHMLNKRRLSTRRWRKRSSKKVTLSWCLTLDIIARLIKNCYPSGLDLLLSKMCLLIMGFMNLKMLMAHHIQIALIMTNWRRFCICDSEDKIHNEFGNDVTCCVIWLHNYLGKCFNGVYDSIMSCAPCDVVLLWLMVESHGEPCDFVFLWFCSFWLFREPCGG